jgi:cytochrome bd ubiquinol oxidase subunit II
VLLFAFHGASYLTLRTTGDLCKRAAGAARRLAVPAALAAAGLLVWTVAVAVDRNDKDVFPPVLPAALGIAVLLLAVVFVFTRRSGWAFVTTALATLAVVATIFTGLYPRVLVSHPDFANSLTLSNAASAHYTLKVMTIGALIFTPLVLLYQSWTYYVFRARVGGDEPASSPVEALAPKRASRPAEP